MRRIGIGPLTAQQGGGVYHFSLNLIGSLSKSGEYQCTVISLAENAGEADRNPPDYQTVVVPRSEFRLFTVLRRLAGVANLRFPFGRYNGLRSLGLHLLISPYPALIGYHLRIPYIVTIQDVMHRYYPDFPEYSWGERLRRDLTYSRAAKHAVRVVIESQTGKDDLVRFYGIPPEKIRVIPLYPPTQTSGYAEMDKPTASEVLRRFSLPEEFILYPAQFWYHKNHIRLMRALHYQKGQGTLIPVVLTGSSTDTYGFKDVQKVSRELNIEDQVLYLGYVSDEEIVALYKKAVALVFPSLIGPTNIPILEAMSLGTPVVCSNLFEMPDQVADAGLTFDPFSVEDMAEKIYAIWSNERLRDELALKGSKIASLLTPEGYAAQWSAVIAEALGSAVPGKD